MSYTKLKVYKKNIVIYYSKNGEVFRFYTGIDLKEFDKKTYDNCVKQIDNNNLPKILQEKKKIIFSQKERIEKNIEELILESQEKALPRPSELRYRLENQVSTKDTLVLESLDKFIEEKRRIFFERNSPSSLKDFISFKNSIYDYQLENGLKLRIKDINRNFLLNYKTFLINKRENGSGFKTKGGLGGRTIKKRFDVIRSYFKWMENYKLNMYDEIVNILNSSDFDLRRITSDVKRFTLNKQQIKFISDLELAEGSPHCKVRDMFLVCSYLGLRFSDLITIDKSQVQENIIGEKFLIRKSVKTYSKQFTVEIPNRINDIFIKYDYNLNLMTNQKANYYLVDLLKKYPEFNIKSELYKKEDNSPYLFWELISFHTARRSFISILLNEEGFSTVEVMRRTDHKKISTLEKYVSPSEIRDKSIRHVFE